MSSNAVEISDVHFAYGDLEIFRGLSLEIPRGKITVEGKNVHTLPADELYQLRLTMGMMFQTSGLFSDLNVFENVAFPIRENFDVPEELLRKVVLMKLHAVGLRGAHAMMPADLSGGMTRRVALARAVATDPRLIMYDEPFAGLDPISLNHIGELIRKMNEALGITSIVVTYDVKEALEVADYAYMICDGVVLARGTPKEFAASGDPYVKQFLHAEPDGPVRFHFPGPPLEEDLHISAKEGADHGRERQPERAG